LRSLIGLIERILHLIPVIIGVSIIVFLLLHITPGDPVETMIGNQQTTQEEITRLRSELGLDKPLHVQFIHFMNGLVTFDLGMSFTQRIPVSQVILPRLPATIELSVLSIIVALLIGIPVGIISAVKRFSLLDKIGTFLSLLGVSMPGFWFSLLLIILFSVTLEWLPIAGRIEHGFNVPSITGFVLIDTLLSGNLAAFIDALKHMIMPSLVLGTTSAALIMRVMRSSMLDVIRQDYILFARAKGLSFRLVILKHALRNALISTVTVVALQMGHLLAGNLIIEFIFGWPGIGQLVVKAIYARDYPVVQGVVLVYAFAFILTNFVADLLYTYLNPRIEL
jgi:ABC-type dipeptide/oligopeptide/nickel transport system permease component